VCLDGRVAATMWSADPPRVSYLARFGASHMARCPAARRNVQLFSCRREWRGKPQTLQFPIHRSTADAQPAGVCVRRPAVMPTRTPKGVALPHLTASRQLRRPSEKCGDRFDGLTRVLIDEF